MEDRRRRIVDFIRQHGEVSIASLKQEFTEVSEMTLRRDLEALDSSKKIVRVHGGAKSIGIIAGFSEEMYARRSRENVEKKELIAKKALKLLEPNTSIFIGSGTTVTALTHVMPDDNFLIFTNGITCAVELTRLTESVIYILGGKLNKKGISINGTQTNPQLENVNFDIVFLGATGFTLETGFTVNVLDDCRFKENILKKARKRVLLVDSSKIGKIMPFTFAMPEDIDVLVTDKEFDAEIIKKLKEKEVKVI